MKRLKCRRRRAQYAAAICLLSNLFLCAHAAENVNLNGIWKITQPQSSFKPQGGAIPFTDAGKKRYEENKRYQAKKQYDEYDHTISRCSSPGMPRVMLTPERFQIFQRPSLITIAFEWNRVRRAILLPDLPAQQKQIGDVADLIGTTMGTSKGQWEGDTLVVTTDKFIEATLIDELVPHGYDLKVTERIRLTDTDTLEDRITIEDPEYFTRPWETLLTYKRQPSALISEDVCLDRLRGPPALPAK